MKKTIVKADCSTCCGTGLLTRHCQRGAATLCFSCDGSGLMKLKYVPFVTRKNRNGIKSVHRDNASVYKEGRGPYGDGIPYKDFKKGKMP